MQGVRYGRVGEEMRHKLVKYGPWKRHIVLVEVTGVDSLNLALCTIFPSRSVFPKMVSKDVSKTCA